MKETRRIDYSDRRIIQDMLDAHERLADIADAVCADPTSVSREIRRNAAVTTRARRTLRILLCMDAPICHRCGPMRQMLTSRGDILFPSARTAGMRRPMMAHGAFWKLMAPCADRTLKNDPARFRAGSRRWFYGVVRGLNSAVLGGMFSYFVLPDAFVMLKTIEENVANAVFMIFE